MRIALGIEYAGDAFLGWQRLGHGASVQAAIESALSSVADHEVAVTCAGRTDARVHARCQVAHFDSAVVRAPRAWMLGANSLLPASVAVCWVQPVAMEFHARFSAISRRYRYRILNRAARAALEHDRMAWERLPLDAERMHRAMQALLGEHDFSAFRALACQARHARRTVLQAKVRRVADEVIVDIEANAFLHHMVRNIVGSLLPIGRGERPEQWLLELLQGRDRAVAGPTAPPQGLTFIGPRYPRTFGLPEEVCA
ncbi:tRNA pseudouridine(38-40) synthase TruA [Metallibacterium scheffleri]|uniref:tRNA pseudouridine synthase A n=1 Tax=Metallibacterium scheffleri TaxID=993689 RepID=A0A4S3KQK5_9GAMM|nr:tRNA pseudouridine(38-40) synthase TruA [Metallibacterium scheffleri]THD11210.1 tRNA pseudouridine(38-40) synthase TruA [Metallibacterium scheffleri]